MVTEPRKLEHGAAPTAEPRGKTLHAHVEMWYPWATALAVSVTIVCLNPSSSNVKSIADKALGPAIDAAAVLAGFEGTALGLLFALVNTQALQRLRRADAYRRLVHYHWHAIASLLAAVVIATSVICTTVVVTDLGRWSGALAALTAFPFIAGTLGALRISWLMFRILTRSDLLPPV